MAVIRAILFDLVIAWLLRKVWAYGMGLINITAEPRNVIEVDLVGVHYQVTPPKAALALKLAVRAKQADDEPGLVLESINEWLTKATGPKEAAKIQKRLDDPEDLLDIKHLMALMEAVIAEGAENPTSSSKGSRS